MNHFDDSQMSAPLNFGGKIAHDHRPQSGNPSQQSFSDSGIKRPRPTIPLSVNRSKLSVPYKSELCNKFQKRRCYYGENCHYAHNLSEIRQPGLDAVGMGEHVSERNGMSRARECQYFASGKACPYGDRCYYLHKCDHLNRESGRGGRDWIDCAALRRGGGIRHYEKFHKTKLCAKWVEGLGKCPYGEKCTYAHGKEELQEPGYYAELENRRDSRLMLDSRPSFTGSCKIGIETAREEGSVHIMEWDIAKISEVYADWVRVGHNFHLPLSTVGS